MTDQSSGRTSLFARLLRLAAIAGLLVALLFGLLAFGPFVAPDIWFADNMSFFLPQLIGGGFAAVFLAAICIRIAGRPRPGKQLRRLFLFTGLVLSVALGLALYHTYRIVAPGLAGASVAGTKNLRIVSINLETRYLGDPDFMAYLESLKPDILVFQETEWPYQMRHRKRQGDDTPLIGLGPYFSNFLIGDLGGVVAFSRYPIRTSTTTAVKGECGPHRYGNREVLTAALDVDGSPFNLVAVHPDSPRSPAAGSRGRTIMQLLPV
ncbi:endonuclease/exonuclease/phosphatase family protein [Pannonibacter sp. Pt2-lr]